MTLESPAHIPDVLLAMLRRMVGATMAEAGSNRPPGPTRDQVHLLVNQLLDAGETLAAMTQPVHVPARQVIRASARAAARQPNGAMAPPGGAPASPGHPDVLVLGPVSVGDEASAELRVHNEGSEPLSGLELTCAAPTSETGARLPGAAVVVSPNPLDLHARSSRSVDVRIAVPIGAAPGTYTGLLRATGDPLIRTVVLIEVV
jgi:hypothetical protein